MKFFTTLLLTLCFYTSTTHAQATTEPVIVCDWCMISFNFDDDFKEGMETFCSIVPEHPDCWPGETHSGYLADPYSGVYMEYTYRMGSGGLSNLNQQQVWPSLITSGNCNFFQVCGIGTVPLFDIE